MSPLRRQNFFLRCWRVLYPIGIHFFIVQLLGSLVLLQLMRSSGGGEEIYYENAVWITGATGILTIFPMLFLYRRDRMRRVEAGLVKGRGGGRLTAWEGTWLFFAGGAMAQFMNYIMVFFTFFLESDYQENMALMEEGKSLGTLIFWLGVAAPVAEELIFRWVVYLRLRDIWKMIPAVAVSGLLFGVYHGNVIQAIYASVLGMVFAWLLEMTGNLLSSILLHSGANIWALIYPEIVYWLIRNSYTVLILPLLGIPAIILITFFLHFSKKGKRRMERLV